LAKVQPRIKAFPISSHKTTGCLVDFQELAPIVAFLRLHLGMTTKHVETMPHEDNIELGAAEIF